MFSPPHYPPFFFLILALTEPQFMLTMLRSTAVNWKHGGRCLHTHRLPVLDPDSGVVTSVALNADWLVAGLANHHIYVFSTHTGSLMHTLVGHELGVWAVDLISHGGVLDSSHPPPSSLNSDGATVGVSGIPKVADGPALLALHNRALAGTQVLDLQGLLSIPSLASIHACRADTGCKVLPNSPHSHIGECPWPGRWHMQ